MKNKKQDELWAWLLANRKYMSKWYFEHLADLISKA